ncbi:MAG: hypothetical protein U0836_13180 [Pirellulales bacterium]
MRLRLKRQADWNESSLSWNPGSLAVWWAIGNVWMLAGMSISMKLFPVGANGANFWVPFLAVVSTLGLWIVLIIATAVWSILTRGPALIRLALSLPIIVSFGLSVGLAGPKRTSFADTVETVTISLTIFAMFAICFLALRWRGYRVVSAGDIAPMQGTDNSSAADPGPPT